MSRSSIPQSFPLCLAMVPLLMAPGLLFYFDITPKTVFLLIVTAVWLLFARQNMFALRAFFVEQPGRRFAYLIGLQAASLVVSAVFSADRALAFTGGVWRRLGAVPECGVLIFTLLLGAWTAAKPGALSLILRSVALAGLVTALYGISQFFGFDPFLPPQAYRAGEGIGTIVRPPSTLGNANYLAGYLVYACFYAAALFASEARGFWKHLGAAAFAIDSAAIAISGTRAGMLGLAVGATLLMFAAGPRRRRVFAGYALAGAALLAAVYFSPAGAPLRARTRWAREDPLGGARLLLWRDSSRMFASRWPVGFGPEEFGREFPKFQSVGLARAYPDFYQESPHNLLIDAAVAQGIPGLAIGVALIALGFIAAWRHRKNDGWIVTCLAAALAGGVVSGQFSSPVLVTRLYQLATIAVLCGIGCSGAPGKVREGGLWVSLFSCLASAIFLLFGIALFASDLGAGALQRSVGRKDIPASVARYRQISNFTLPGFAVDLYASRALAQLSIGDGVDWGQRAAAWQEAVRAGQRATQTADDRQNAYFNMAQLTARQNDIPGTERNLRAAILTAPNWFKPHWVLAELLRRTNRPAEAREEARLAFERDAGKDPEVTRTWELFGAGSPR